MNQKSSKILRVAAIVLIALLLAVIFLNLRSVPDFRAKKAAVVVPVPEANALLSGGNSEQVPVNRSRGNLVPARFSLVGHWHSREGFGADSPNKSISVDYYFDDDNITEVSKLPDGGDIHVTKDRYTLAVIDQSKGLVKLETDDYAEALQYPEGKVTSVKFSDIEDGKMEGTSSHSLIYVDALTEPQE